MLSFPAVLLATKMFLVTGPDDEFKCVGYEYHADGSEYPLAAFDLEHAMSELDPFQHFPGGLPTWDERLQGWV